MTIASDWPLPEEGIRFFVPKIVTDALATTAQTKDLYPLALGYYPCAHGHRMVRAQHHDNLLIVCTQGKGHLHWQNQEFIIQSGDLLVLPRNCAHEYFADKEQPWSIYWCHFAGQLTNDYIDNLIQISEPPIIRLGSSNLERNTLANKALNHSVKIQNSFQELLEVRKTGYNLAHFIHSSNQLKHLLSYISLLLQTKNSNNSEDIAFDTAIAHMHKSLNSHLELEQLAELSGLSKYYFSRRFKQLMGYAPIQYFIHLKMEHACYLLDTKSNSIEEIATELGYDDAFYFSRIFKKVIGLSPKQYRLAARG